MTQRIARSVTALFLFVLLWALTPKVFGQGPFTRLTFSDEFSRPARSPIDASKWTAETGGHGWGNQELQYYTNLVENAYHDGRGSLVIKAIRITSPAKLDCWYGQCQYTSARLITKQKFEQKFGRFEARIKIPGGRGMWPAFWLLGNNIDSVGWPKCGEIDVMENIGREPSTVHGTIHGPGYSGPNSIGAPYGSKNKQVFAADFHVYAAEWTEGSISFYVDRNLYKTLKPEDIPQGTTWVYDHPFFLILNLAIGGPWGGNPDGTTVFPGMMLVDYVRVYGR